MEIKIDTQLLWTHHDFESMGKKITLLAGVILILKGNMTIILQKRNKDYCLDK